jgi:hypothetical protein
VLKFYLHLRKQVSFNTDVQVTIVLIKVVLEISIRKFVACLILTIVLGILLNGIVCQMNHPIRQVLKCEFSTTSSKVAIGIEVTFNVTVNRTHESVEPYIEFTLVN